MSENTLLDKLEGLSIRFEEVGTLITDPAVLLNLPRNIVISRKLLKLKINMRNY